MPSLCRYQDSSEEDPGYCDGRLTLALRPQWKQGGLIGGAGVFHVLGIAVHYNQVAQTVGELEGSSMHVHNLPLALGWANQSQSATPQGTLDGDTDP